MEHHHDGSHEGQKHAHTDGPHEHGHVAVEFGFALAAGFFVLSGALCPLLFESAPSWLPTALFVAAYVFGGLPTAREALENLRKKTFKIDSLMLVAALGAAALGEWFEGALLLFLFSLGHALEHYAMSKARGAIASLAQMAPDEALVVRDGVEELVPIEALVIGDRILVKPNERLPADGFVLEGHSAINQAPITGESVPVDKRPIEDPELASTHPSRLDAAHRVFAGTINGQGALSIQVTRISSESALAKVVQLVSEAEEMRSPTQAFTDKFERIFVPSVLVFVLALLFAPLIIDETFAQSFYRAMAVLVAASPCALAIATPSAVLSAVTAAGRSGVLVKGGGPLEHLGALKAVAFDKTGTLTEGRPRVTSIETWDGAEEAELLGVAGAVESLSDHPLARAVVRRAAEVQGRDRWAATNLESATGLGVRAMVHGQAALIGKQALFQQDGCPPIPDALKQRLDALEDAGHTTMIVYHGERYLGVLGLMDTPRPEARGTIERLRTLGIAQMIMISGDNQSVADAVARMVGLDRARGDLMPEDKVAFIKELSQSGPVAMVGDGVNDAPAMASADVGIAMGAAGSDTAFETAQVALMADSLNKLPFAIALGRKTSRIIRQNLWMSLGMVAILLPSTLLGLGIGPAVALHEGSTLLVVFNALRLLAFRDVDPQSGQTEASTASSASPHP